MKRLNSFTLSTRSLAAILTLLVLVASLPMSVFASDVLSLLEEREDASSTEGSDVLAQSSPAFSVDPFEVVELREERTKYFRNSDGTFVAAQYDTPVHTLDADGVWQDIDNSLSLSGDEYSTKNAKVKFAKKLNGNNELLKLIDGSTKLTLSLDGANKKAQGSIVTEDESGMSTLQKMMNLEKLSARVLYTDALENVDIEYIASNSSVKENIIIKNRLGSYSFSFTMKLSGLSAALAEDNSIVITDVSNGSVKYIIPAPIAFDSAGSFADDSQVRYALTYHDNGKYTLTVTVSDAWASDSSRAFPVTVDPPIFISGNSNTVTTACIDEANPTASSANSTSLYVGRDSGGNEKISYVRFSSLPTLPQDAHIISSSFNIFLYSYYTSSQYSTSIGVYDVTSHWASSITWNTINNHTTIGTLGKLTDYVNLDGSSVPTTLSWDITTLMNEWYNGRTNYGIAIKQLDERLIQLYLVGNASTTNKPYFTINYKPINGTEDYFSSIEHSSGIAGTSIINTTTGALTHVFSGIQTPDSLVPYTPELIFNSNYAGQYYYPGQTTVTSRLAYGWKMKSNQVITYKTYIDTSGSTVPYYVWIDGDGTEHDFYCDFENNIYRDTDGLGMKLNVYPRTMSDGTKYLLSDSSGNRTYFNVDGFMYKCADTFGNERIFTIQSNIINTVSYKPAGSTEYAQIKYVHNANMKLNQIRYVNGASDTTPYKIIYLYYSNTYNGALSANYSSFLRKIEICSLNSTTNTYDVDGYACYEYDVNGNLISTYDSVNGYTVTFGYDSRGRVISCTEKSDDGNSVETTNTIQYLSNHTIVRSPGMDSVINDSDDILTHYLTDNYCRLVNIYSTNVSYEIYSSSSIGYVDSTNNVLLSNKVSNTASAPSQKINYLENGDFNGGVSPPWAIYGSASFTNEGYRGTALKFDFPSAGALSSYIMQSKVLQGGTYTFSAYVKPSQNNATSVNLSVTPGTGTVYSKTIDGSLTNNAGYVKMFVTFTISEETNCIFKVNISRTDTSSQGNYYIILDDLTVCNSESPENNSLIRDGSFEIYNSNRDSYTYWTVSSASRITNTANDRKNDLTSLIITSNINNYSFAYQDIPLMTQAEITAARNNFNSYTQERYSLILAGWAKAQSVALSSNKTFALEVYVTYITESGSGQETKYYYFPFNSDITDWQYVNGSVLIDPEIGHAMSISVYCTYDYNVGSALFDSITLVRSSDTVSYTYTDDGKIERTLNTDPNADVEYDYNDDGDVERIEYNDSSFVEISYVNRKISEILQQSKTGIITETTNTYNTYGLLTNSVTKTEGSFYQVKRNTYSTDPIIFGALLTETDERMQVTRYYYETEGVNPGVLKAVISPDGTGMTYTYDNLGRTLSQLPAEIGSTNGYSAVTDSANVTYEYDQYNRLSGITTDSSKYSISYNEFGDKTAITVNGANSTSDGIALSRYIYNAYTGFMKYCIYENGYVVKYEYDELGRVIKELTCTVSGTLPANESGFDALTYTTRLEYMYNAGGSLYKLIDYSEGAEYYYEYDSEGRVRNQWKAKISDSSSLELVHVGRVDYNSKSLISAIYESYAVTVTDPTTGEEITKTFTDNVFADYDDDDRLIEYAYGDDLSPDKIVYGYDVLNRVISENTTLGSYNNILEYEYLTVPDSVSGRTVETGLVSKHTSTVKHNGSTLSETEYNYTYDERGNITLITNASGVVQNRFFYDDLNQLIREDNRAAKRTVVYDYDDAGNIVRKRIWNVKYIDATPENDYSELGTPSYDYAYTYANAEWGDLLTKYRGGNITYDEIGNPLSYYDGRRFYFQWEGRQLTQLTLSNVVTTFEYNADGLRTNKTTGGVSHDYIWSGDTLLAEVTDDYILRFIYDASGNVLGFEYLTPETLNDGITYYYEKNIFGDVVAIYDEYGTMVGAYGFNSYGQNHVVTNLTDDNIASLNPIRYRSYYYDADIYLYYLQSRYYDPVTCRFINGDNYLNANGDILGFNMFAYCSNNPVVNIDPTGKSVTAVIAIIAVCGIIGGAMGAFTAASTGGDVVESTIEGCLVGMAGAACGILFPAGWAMVAGCLAGGIIDLATQVTSQCIEGKSITNVTIDVQRAIKTTALTGIGAGIPYFGQRPFDFVNAVATAVAWAECSVLFGCGEVVVTHAIRTATQNDYDDEPANNDSNQELVEIFP